MLSAAWRVVAKSAVDKNDEARINRLRHAIALPQNRFPAVDR